MCWHRSLFLTVVALALGVRASAADPLAILEKRCLSCHDAQAKVAGLDLSSLEAAKAAGVLVPGDVAASKLIECISKGEMPPGAKLPDEEIATLKDWVAQGAPWGKAIQAEQRPRSGPGWWAWQKLRGEQAQGLDAFVDEKLAERGMERNLPADRRTLIRRVTFDLTGLPPTPEEVDGFIADDRPGAYEELVDRLLASPAYGERWGRHWLDVVRFGESNGYEQNHLRNSVWPYRDWVIRSLNEDKPFNRMIVEQLAGDQIAPGDPKVEAATGFLVAGPHDTVGIKNPEGEAQKRANHLDDMITATASAFLGLTVHCARCHDHKFDPIQQKDYYRMQAAFAGVWHDERNWATPAEVDAYESAAEPLRQQAKEAKEALEALREGAAARVEERRDAVLAGYRPSVEPEGAEERFEPVEARLVRMTIEAPTARRNVVDLDEFEIWTSDSRNVALDGEATARSTRIDEASPDTYAARNLVDGKFDKRWISAGGMPEWVEVKLPRAERIARVFWSSDRLKGFGGRFGRSIPEHYRIEVSLDGEQWKTVADSEGRLPFSEEDRERLLLFAVFTDDEKQAWEEAERREADAQKRLAKLDKPARAFLGRFEQPEAPSFVMVRGNPMDKGDEVAPASLSTLGDLLPGFALDPTALEADRRLALARWIASDDNALTARVIANRIWMYHFGGPLVRAPSDFGYNGGEPTHPELLDWLAGRLVGEHGWRLKPLHRDIVLSAAYRQSSDYREDAAKADHDAEYLWRFPPRRLEAEEVRDAVLAISGKLDRTMGGPGFRLYRYTVDNVATYYPLEEFGPETFRRSVYHQHARSVKPELLGQFDCPDTSLPAPKRVSTTTPLQALSLLNNAFLIEQAGFLAERLEREAGGDAAAQVELAWRLAFGRSPEAEESADAVRFIEQQGLALFCRALFNANELVYVH
ncbi:MAG: DUF1553 domain-containing protein [Acidobacteria bacterium]|nr:DUF1553 domain-containing protein [Acidobacteriota bacterium]